MEFLEFVIVVTDEDGIETAQGPWPEAEARARAESTRMAFPQAHVRAVPLLSIRAV